MGQHVYGKMNASLLTFGDIRYVEVYFRAQFGKSWETREEGVGGSQRRLRAEMTAIWDEMPPILTNIGTHEVGTNPRFLEWLENLKAKITQLHECLGEYHSEQWCDHCIIDSKCAQITLYVQELKEKAEKYDELKKTDNKIIYDLSHKLEAVKIAFEAHRDNLIELSVNLTQISHEPELPEEYHYAIEKIATNMISYGELRKILEEKE